MRKRSRTGEDVDARDGGLSVAVLAGLGHGDLDDLACT